MFNRVAATVLTVVAALAGIAPVLADASSYAGPGGATGVPAPVHGLHMMLFWVCVAIAVAVFSAIIYSIVRFRQSAGTAPDKVLPHSTQVEVVWTLVPAMILVATAIPAARALIVMDDTRDPGVSVMVTGYQWRWHYDYLGTGVSFYSTLAGAPNDARQLRSRLDAGSVKDQLLDVDNPLVIPVDTTVRLLLTANDVIHSWSVPDFAINTDAVPGLINEASFRARKTGRFIGQCAELCGRDHGFMPIVVEVLSRQDYARWLAAKQEAARAVASGAAAAAIATTAMTASPAAASAARL